MGKAKIDPIKMKELMDAGYGTKELSEYFGCSMSAISMRKKDLNIRTTAVATMQNANSLVSDALDTMGQLRKANQEVNNLLDLLTALVRGDQDAEDTMSRIYELGRKTGNSKLSSVNHKDPMELILLCAKEIRQQNRFCWEVMQSIYDMHEVEKSRQIILDCIGRASPQVRNECVRLLRERRLLRESTRITR